MDYSQLKGDERVKEMKRLRHIHNFTNTEIGRLFNNLSRERVRQLIGNTGRGFVTRRRKKIWEENKHKTNAELKDALGLSSAAAACGYREGERHEVKGGGWKVNYDHVNYVSNLLKSKGIEHQLTKAMSPYDIHLENGNRLCVLSASQLFLPNIYSPLYSFNTRQDVKGRFCDFFICVTSDTLNVFIIPAMKTRMNSPIRFCYPKDHGKISKWVQYHGRFDLLEVK